jgi:prepilin-type N-terminal cleavage/methylation domain-containing protein
MPMSAAAERRGERGFSLVEVLCAVAIAASAIVVLSSGTTGALKGARALDMHLGAQVILRSILEDELAAADTAPATREGDSGPYRWTLEIEPAPEGKLPPSYRMYRLTASVSWDRGGLASATVMKLAR